MLEKIKNLKKGLTINITNSMIYSLEVIYVMHSNLIKVNEDLAFAKNKEGVISLINKKHDDYSFEDIEKKESEIAILEADIKKINEEYQNEFIELKESKRAFLKELRSTILVGVPTIALICFIISQGFGLALVFGSIPLVIATDFEIRMIKDCFASYAKMKKYAKNPDDSKEKLTQIKELLNTKKAELEQMLDKVDYREYSKKEEIASILNNMLNITTSKAPVNSLTSDISNVQSLNGPSLNRKRD